MSSLQTSPFAATQADALFQILDSVLEPRSCAYVAGPLESGKTYYERVAAGDELLTIRAENESRLSEFAQGLRKRLAYPVFDPGLLKIPRWSGPDYGNFFMEVIRRYARACWFLDGWEFSTGATKEFLLCCTIKVPCWTETEDALDVGRGIQLITRAADCVRELNLTDQKLRSRLAELERLQGQVGSFEPLTRFGRESK